VSHQRIDPLTSLRFVAALHVVLFHTSELYQYQWPLVMRNIIGEGYIAVSLFFVLSGFVLAHANQTDNGVQSVRKFWWARFARLYPVYLLGFFLMLPRFLEYPPRMSMTGQPLEPFWVLISQLTLTQAWFPATALTMNFPGWSLSVEAFLSLVFPAMVVWLDRSRWAHSSLGLLIGLIFVWLLAMISPTLYTVLQPDGLREVRSSSFSSWIFLLRYNPLMHLTEFMAGMLLHRLWLQRSPTCWQCLWRSRC
jgi:peptidoglycan/LPS O-acetylase OafA/YrhL